MSLKPDATETRAERLLWSIVLAGQLAVPLFFLNGSFDLFRAPKYVAFRTEAILLIAVALIGLIWKRVTPIDRRDPALWFAAAAIIWTTLCTLTSVNRRVSLDSLITVVAAAAIFLAVRIVAAKHRFTALNVMLAAALINGILGMLQLLDIWRPFVVPDPRGKFAMTGLVGTSNDLGMLLLAPTVVALVACMISIGWKRGVYGAVAGLLAITLLAAQSIAAIAAFATALVLLAITAFRRRGLVPLIAGAVLLIGAVFAYAPLRDRVMFVRRAAQQHRYNDLTSLRVPPFLAAWTMFAQHPLLGIGPGGFHSQYLSYRIDVSRRYPQLMPDTASAIENFGETHNDHLQLLAETGAPGYLLLLAFVIFIASASFQRQASEMDDGDPRVRFCRMAALPLAGSFLVLALAQFPMQIAAASIEYLLIAGTLMAWRVSHA